MEEECALLESHGHELCEFSRYSDKIISEGVKGIIKGALSTPWNPFAARAIRKEVNKFSPDIVHVHNTFPLLSPSIFYSVGFRAARVLTLHNYRLFCPAAIPMRNGKVCTECIERRSVKPSLRYGCYRNSRMATIPPAFSVYLHRNLGTWINQVDAFITLTKFQRDLMIDAGLPANLVHVKPNFYPGNPTILPWKERRASVVFAGRLTVEKGVESLLKAWIMWGASAPQLIIVGDGPLRGKLEQLVAQNPQVPIRFLGHQSVTATQAEIARACLLILPSQCFEGFPMVLREAFAFGTPVAVSNIGPLSSIVNVGENGVVFSPGNPQSLLDVVRAVWESKSKLERLATGARLSFETQYTETTNYKLLMRVYQKAIEVSRKRNA